MVSFFFFFSFFFVFSLQDRGCTPEDSFINKTLVYKGLSYKVSQCDRKGLEKCWILHVPKDAIKMK